ncbi:MAG: peptidylprolyl isomerase [Cytophagales bacterium]|nr:peptidylprolyl isomerase [Cytophagales bacterium]
MALINTLRNRMGKIVIVFIAFSMGAFILTDLLQSNSVLLGGASTEIGEMASSEVSYEEFQAEVERLSYNYLIQFGTNPNAQAIDQIRQQAWQELIIKKVFGPQFDQLGIEVTDDEMIEMVQGKNIHPDVQRNFSDPQTGLFNKEQLMTFLQQISSAPVENQRPWKNFEASLRPSRELTKYENLLAKTTYANKYESKGNYVTNNSTASIDFLYVPFFSVADSSVDVTESELQDYLDSHADEYQSEESKNIDYIVFEVKPSAEDSAVVRQEVNDLREELLTSENDSLFASINSEGFAPYNTYNAGTLPPEMQGAEVGDVTEPIVSGNTYTIYKLSDKVAGDEEFVKVSHILFKWTDESDEAKAEARRQGNQILRDIKNGTNFEEMARVHGTDGTRTRGGDLGWFGENSSFVQEFKDACFNFRGTGLLPSLVETSFGFHIIKVTEPKTNESFKVAKIERELFVSDETQNSIYRNADQFALESKNLDDFVTNATDKGYEIQKATKIGQNDQRLGSINEARNVIFWLYNKADDGDVSEVFETDDKYIIAIATSTQEKGTANLDDVRNEITKKVRDQKKANQLIAKLASLSGSSLEELQEQYGDDARVNSADINLSSTSIANVGYAPNAVGLAFALESGEQTAPFKVDNGVMIVSLSDKNMAADLDNYDAYQLSVLNNRRSFKRREAPVIDQNIYDVAIDFADIVDERYKFF